MKNKLSYSELYYILNELHDCLQQDNYPTLYLETLEEVQHTLLILELLNIAHTLTTRMIIDVNLHIHMM